MNKFATRFGSDLDGTSEEKPRHSRAMLRFFRLRRVQRWSEDWMPICSSYVLSSPKGMNVPSVLESLRHVMFPMFRARETITSHFHIPSSGHLGPIFTRKILNVDLATPAVVLPQIDPICPKPGREFWEVIVSRTLSPGGGCFSCG